MNNFTGRASGRYYYPDSFKEKRASIERKPYRKASIRLRGVGSNLQTSIRLANLYEPHFTVGPYVGEMKTAAGRLMAQDLFG